MDTNVSTKKINETEIKIDDEKEAERKRKEEEEENIRKAEEMARLEEENRYVKK